MKKFLLFVGALFLTITSVHAAEVMPVGGDRDTHGCIGSAGYVWSPLAGECIRPWESRVRVLTIAPETQICSGVGLHECLMMRSSPGKWRPLYGNIQGFDFVPGYTYRLRVLETKIANPPTDAPSVTYKLLKVISRR